MAQVTAQKLKWSIVRLGKDMNWYVKQLNKEINWDAEGLGILDPKQIHYIVELCEPLRDYGFDPEVIENSFFAFGIEKELENARIQLMRNKESLLSSEEMLFALPDLRNDDKSPYADFISQITQFRVDLLNDSISGQTLTVDDIEEEIRESHENDSLSGDLHTFQEITAILEYVPEGFELDADIDEKEIGTSKENIDDFPDIEVEEKIDEDDTMRWEEEEEDGEEYEEDDSSDKAGS